MGFNISIFSAKICTIDLCDAVLATKVELLAYNKRMLNFQESYQSALESLVLLW